MTGEYQYAYLLGNLFILFPIWLLFFLRRSDLRREMVTTSLFCGLLGPISQLWYLQDYWHPQTFMGWLIGPEDFIFGFLAGGIASIMYEVVFSKRFAQRRRYRARLVPVMVIIAFTFSLYLFSLVNSIYIGIIFFAACATLIAIQRPDLREDIVMSGMLGGVIALISYTIFLWLFPGIIEAWWKLPNLSGMFIASVPLEEFFWAFGFGAVAGPAYEFLTGKRFVR